MNAKQDVKRYPKISKSLISRMKEVGNQKHDNKMVFALLENFKTGKKVYVLGCNVFYDYIIAIVVKDGKTSHEKIKIKDIEAEKDLKTVIFKEQTLKDLNMLPESAGNQILLESYNWVKEKGTDTEKKDERNKPNEKEELTKEFESIRNASNEQDLER